MACRSRHDRMLPCSPFMISAFLLLSSLPLVVSEEVGHLLYSQKMNTESALYENCDIDTYYENHRDGNGVGIVTKSPRYCWNRIDRLYHPMQFLNFCRGDHSSIQRHCLVNLQTRILGAPLLKSIRGRL